MSGDFSIDLKLDGIGNTNHESLGKWTQPEVAKPDTSSSESMKRLRASNNRRNIVTCLVDGCTSDLSNCRDYHRRHKVCETHTKTPQVTIRGLKQRFCQQCSRFHSMEEFDEGKKSCRKRLDGHNRRRRKPQLNPIYQSGSFFSSFPGSQLLQFSGSHVYPATTITNPSWSAKRSSQDNARLYNLHQQMHFPDKQGLFLGSSLVNIYEEGKQFPFLQSDHPSMNDQTSATDAIGQPLLRTISLSETNGGIQSMFCDKLTVEVPKSDCAFSLLSSRQKQTQNSENHMLQAKSKSLLQPIDLSFHDHSLGDMDSVLASIGRGSSIPCLEMFQMQSGPGGSSGFNSPQTLPFCWE